MKITLGIARYEYGRKEFGDSYEYSAWFRPLVELGHEVTVVDVLAENGAGEAGLRLLEHVRDVRPDAVLTMMFEDEIPLSVLDQMRALCPVANWFTDDTWRFGSYSRHLAPHLDLSITTSRAAETLYREIDGARAVFMPWGFNPDIFRKVDCPEESDVSFVGLRYGRRGRTIEQLRSQGIEVRAQGRNWPEGSVETAELSSVFARARINLNFLESSAGPLRRRGFRFRGVTRIDELINRRFRPPLQLKARPFEIAGSGAFLLSNSIPELAECLVPGREFGVFRSEQDLPAQIRYWLHNADERRSVAAAGYARAHAEHTWQRRLTALLEALFAY